MERGSCLCRCNIIIITIHHDTAERVLVREHTADNHDLFLFSLSNAGSSSTPQEYAQRGFAMRFILSKGDSQKFTELDRDIHHAMEVRRLHVTFTWLCSLATYP